MQNLIGEKLDAAIEYLEKNKIKYSIIDNNFSVKGDTKLVLNVVTKDETVNLITGDFIFDVRNK